MALSDAASQGIDLLVDARRLSASGDGRRLRQSAHLSLLDVAAVVQVAPVTVSRWERATRVPHGPGALAWARLLRRLEKHAS